MKLSNLYWLGLLFLLTACQGGAVVFAPTPIPPELAPTRYEHPTGAFQVLLPSTWTLYEQSSTTFAAASFAPPHSPTPLVQIAVLNIGQPIQGAQLANLILQYQSEIRPDLSRYTEQNRQAMGDGSWRITGLRTSITGETQEVNTFIAYLETQLGIIEVTLPTDAALRSQLQSLVNTFSLQEADLPVTRLSDLSGLGQAELEIVNLATWISPEGIFFVTGEVTNHGTESLANVPVRATLLADTGEVLADAFDLVMGHAIEAGGFAPFSIRFGSGQPINATSYRVSLSSEDYTRQTLTVLGRSNLEWTDATQFTADADLFITGTVRNTGTSPLRAPRAIATVFDERGRVIGAGFVDLEHPLLQTGETVSFTILISDLGGSPANYVVNVQALPCDDSC